MIADLRLALRQLAKAPGFSVTTLLILALGIGGVTAMFSTLYAVMVRPLPYPEPDRLVLGRAAYAGEINPVMAGPDYVDYREQSRSFSALEGFMGYAIERSIVTGTTTERLGSLLVSPGLFRLLGANPIHGRLFTDAEGRDNAPAVALVSHTYWQRHFADEKALGERTLIVDGRPHTLVGVMPSDFHFAPAADIWLPLRPQNLGPRRYNNFLALGRLKDGVSLAEAQSDVDVISARLQKDFAETHRTKSLVLTPLQGAITESYQSGFAMLCGGAAAILLIACANAAGLLLARGASRRGELAVRAALGASPWRIMRVLLAEALLLAVGAGVLGTLLAFWMQSGLTRLFSIDALFLQATGISWPVLGFVASISVLTGIGFGLLPAWRARRPDLVDSLKTTGKGGTRHGSRLRGGLVAGQVGLSFLLLVVAGLMTRSLRSLHRADPGFDPRQLLTVEVPLPPRIYNDEQRVRFFASLLENIRALPGVRSAAAISQLPLRNPSNDLGVYAADAPPQKPGDAANGYQRVVQPGYFETMGIPLLAGRDVRDSDTAKSPRVVVVSQVLAERLFPGRDPLGRSVIIDGAKSTPWEVVGVVGDVKAGSLRNNPRDRGAFYRPHAQLPIDTMRLAIRTENDPHAIVTPLRELLTKMDAAVPLSGPRTMEQIMSNDTVGEKGLALCLAVFSAFALVLAAVGIYGVLAYNVAQQRRDIGIRMALGASHRDVAWTVLRHAGLLALLGAAGGMLGALGVSHVIRAALYGIGPQDPVAFAGAAAILVLIAALAAWLPARRAARVNPVEALRAE